jgi:hypothetical protein
MPDDQAPPDFTWIETCDSEIAREARDILAEVLHEMDLMHDPQMISPYPRGTDDLKWRGYHEGRAAVRGNVVEKLLKHRVLRSAEWPQHVSDHDLVGPRIEADEATVREAHRRLQDRFGIRPALRPSPVPQRSSERPRLIRWFTALNVVWQLLIGIATIVGTVVAIIALKRR